MLSDLPNIGPELAKCLIKADIDSPEKLHQLGSVEAAARISPFRPSQSSCRSALCALEGAIRGIRWHTIPKEDRDKLGENYLLRTVQPD